MRKFILTSLAFLALVVLTLGGWAWFLYRLELAAYRRDAQMPKGTLCAVCSDSQTELGLRAETWPHFFNFSSSGIQLDQMEIKTYDLLSRNPGLPKTLLIDISPRKLAAQDIDKPLIATRRANKRFLLYLLHPRMSRRSLDGIVTLFRDSILVRRSGRALASLLTGKKYSSSIGAHRNPEFEAKDEAMAKKAREVLLAHPAKVGFRDHRKLACATLNEHLEELNACAPVTMQSKTVDCIRSIIAITRSFGVRPVLMTAPLHPDFRAGMREGMLENFKQIMRALAKECDVPYLDYLELPFAEEEWRDANHLNIHGAVRFTDRVRADLNGMIPQE